MTGHMLLGVAFNSDDDTAVAELKRRVYAAEVEAEVFNETVIGLLRRAERERDEALATLANVRALALEAVDMLAEAEDCIAQERGHMNAPESADVIRLRAALRGGAS